ncbi:hypothetical protein PS1_001726 [Malus domestica]
MTTSTGPPHQPPRNIAGRTAEFRATVLCIACSMQTPCVMRARSSFRILTLHAVCRPYTIRLHMRLGRVGITYQDPHVIG